MNKYNRFKPTVYQKFVNITAGLELNKGVGSLWLGSKFTVDELIKRERVEVLVVLDGLDGKIWDSWGGGIIEYYPISDYSVLPKRIEQRLVDAIVNHLNQGRNVALFCHGGIGRTSYIASLVLQQLGVELNCQYGVVEYLRANYNSQAVESIEQLERVVITLKEYKHWEKIINDNLLKQNMIWDNYQFNSSK